MFANTVRKIFVISKNSVTELYARSTYNFVRLFLIIHLNYTDFLLVNIFLIKFLIKRGVINVHN